MHPIGIDSIILSAVELGSGTTLTTDTLGAFSVNVNLASSAGSTPLLTLPLVQGMGFISGIYSSATVLIQSNVVFKQLSPSTKIGNVYRWTVLLADGHEWAIYITPSGGSAPVINLDGSGNSIKGSSGFSGLVQIAKLEDESDGNVYDLSAGAYPVSASISATASGSYSLGWSKKGDTSKTLIMFALPHHVQSFASDTASHATTITLHALTKGKVVAVVADKWNLVETLPTS